MLEILTKNIDKNLKEIVKTDDDVSQVELEESEKINLYEILEKDRDNVLNNYLLG